MWQRSCKRWQNNLLHLSSSVSWQRKLWMAHDCIRAKGRSQTEPSPYAWKWMPQSSSYPRNISVRRIIIKAFPVSEMFVNNRSPVNCIIATCKSGLLRLVFQSDKKLEFLFEEIPVSQLREVETIELKRVWVDIGWTCLGLSINNSKMVNPAAKSDQMEAKACLFSRLYSSRSSNLNSPNPEANTTQSHWIDQAHYSCENLTLLQTVEKNDTKVVDYNFGTVPWLSYL